MKSFTTLAILLFSLASAFPVKAEDSMLLKMCKESTSISALVPQCMEQFKGLYISDFAIATCKSSTTITQLVPNCVLEFANMRFTSFSLLACQESTTITQLLPTCMLRLKDLAVTKENYETCKTSTITQLRIDCLIKIAIGFDQLNISATKLLKMALREMDLGNYKKAKKLVRMAKKMLESKANLGDNH